MGQVKVAYRFLDWILEREISKYFKPCAEQKRYIRKSVKEYLNWHRSQILPLYSHFFKHTIENLEAKKADKDFFVANIKSFRKIWQETFLGLVPFTGEFLLQLRPDQQVFLKGQMEKRYQKLQARCLGSPEQEKERLFKKNYSLMKHFVGRVSEEQGELLSQAIETCRFPNKEYLNYRAQMQKRFLDLLCAESLSKDSVENFISSWLMQYKEVHKQDYLEAQHRFDEELAEILLKAMQNLSSKQEAFLQKRVNSYVTDFQELSEK